MRKGVPMIIGDNAKVTNVHTKLLVLYFVSNAVAALQTKHDESDNLLSSMMRIGTIEKSQFNENPAIKYTIANFMSFGSNACALHKGDDKTSLAKSTLMNMFIFIDIAMFFTSMSSNLYPLLFIELTQICKTQ